VTRSALCASVFGLLGMMAATAAGQCRPISGCERLEFATIDQAMEDFLCDQDVPGATLAIARDGIVLYERGFGWSDEARTKTMSPNALLRMASVSKPLTVAAVRELISDGAFTLDSHVFDLGQPEGGLLDLEPFPSLGDDRLANVTVRHLILHRGGWNRDVAGDLTYREVMIANALGIASPPGRENTVRYILGQPLQFSPGEERSYSNIGCLVLGLIIEQESGVSVDRFIQERVLSPLGIEDDDHQAGRTFATDQADREPWYRSTTLAVNVFDPGGPLVRRPYGGWDHEARIGQGGQIATAGALATLAAHRWVNGDSIGLPKSPALRGGWRWNHTGSLNGTGTLIRQRGDGVTYAVLMNDTGLGGTVRGVLDPVLDAIVSWPTDPPACCQPDLDGDGSLSIFDFLAFQNLFDSDSRADFDGDASLTIFDFLAFQNAFDAGC